MLFYYISPSGGCLLCIKRDNTIFDQFIQILVTEAAVKDYKKWNKDFVAQ